MKRTVVVGMTMLGLVLVGALTNISRSIEVTPPSPVPALSPTVISVTYAVADNSFVMVIGVVNGQMYLPEVNDAGPGKLTFSGPPGQYAVMGIEAGKRFQTTVVVEGDDSPDPPVPPVPGKRSVYILYESEQSTPAFALATQKLQQYQQDKKSPYRLVDKDSRTPDGKTPTWLQEMLAKAATAKVRLPVFVIVSSGGGVDKAVFVPFPSEDGKAIEVLKKYGG